MASVTQKLSARRLMMQIILGGAIIAPLILAPGALADRPSRRYPAHRDTHHDKHHDRHCAPRRRVKVHVTLGQRRIYCPPPRRRVYIERVVTCPPPRRPVYVERVVRVENVSYPAHDRRPVQHDSFYGLTSRGWDDLRYGDYLTAKRRFRDEIDSNPYAPVLEIGYSMATGRLEHYRESIRSMRRAVNLDVTALIAVRENCDLRREAEYLLDQYREVVRYDSRDADALFMSAALESILGNWKSADRLIDDAARIGDYSSSTRELHRFIESR